MYLLLPNFYILKPETNKKKKKSAQNSMGINGIVIYLDFHSTKLALWLVDSWSHAPDKIQMYDPTRTVVIHKPNKTACFCHMIV